MFGSEARVIAASFGSPTSHAGHGFPITPRIVFDCGENLTKALLSDTLSRLTGLRRCRGLCPFRGDSPEGGMLTK